MSYGSFIKIFIELRAFIALEFQFTEVICQYFNTFALLIEIKNKINFFHIYITQVYIFFQKRKFIMQDWLFIHHSTILFILLILFNFLLFYNNFKFFKNIHKHL
jgi:hypothetical protein